jgi:hypothetical protein
MATKIILTVTDGLTAQETEDLRYLLSDALGDFAAGRNDAAEYVDKRYPGTDYYPEREEKIQQVLRRVRLARKLHDAALSFETRERHTNHAVCIAMEKPCARTCYAEGSETLAEIIEEGAGRTNANIKLLGDMFGVEGEEARALCNQLEDRRISKLMVEHKLAAQTPYTEKRRMFEQVFAHEVAHHTYGTKPDIETLTKLLLEVFS